MPGRGAAGTDEAKPRLTVKSSSTKSLKKMVQARLPFKRLNPVPKEGNSQGKKQKVSQKAPPVNTICPLDISLEDTENGTEAADFSPLPKAVNGLGPLDNYIRKTKKTCLVIPSITIDLTEDSSNGVADHIPSNGTVQSSPAGNIPASHTLDSVASTHSDVAHGSSSIPSTVHSCTKSQTDGPRLSPHAVEAPSETALENASVLTTPVKAIAEDQDMSADDSPTGFSSTSSPISASSPEAASSNQRDASSCVPTTPLNKGKEQQERKRKMPVDKERMRVRELQLAKKKEKEEAKKKKDEERELKAKERKEKKEKENLEKAEKLRLKEEKKKEKLEALEAKQEEKRKKEEEKRIKIEEKRVKAEKAEITRFLQKSKTSQIPKTFAQPCGKFAPFEIKKNMTVAPLCRVEFEQESLEQLDKLLEEQDSESSFLSEIKVRKPRRMGRTMMPQLPSVPSNETEDVQVLEDTALPDNVIIEEPNMPESRKPLGKLKLLQFCENYRPAYWGTWNRSSTVINPRKPWAQDSKLLDYEVDSDEEWEEEEPGESLSHSEGDEDDDDTKEDDEDDDGFFVPHGYLSEDEGGISDEECKNPENQKVQQRLKAKEWDELQSKGKKINVLKPLVVGCVWLGNCSAETRFLQKFAVCLIDPAAAEENAAPEVTASKSLQDREILLHLLPLLHGNVHGSKTIIKEFQECCQRGVFSFGDAGSPTACETVSPNSQNHPNINLPSKARLKRIISENSVYEKRPDHRLCWYVHADVLKSFQQEGLPVPCQWTYITQVNLCSRDESGTSGAQTPATSSKRKAAGSMPITKFMKKTKALGTVRDVTTLESDGFQADTEEDEEDDDDDDCLIVEPDEKDKNAVSSLCSMEITLDEKAAPAT
ncbi:hypothetical protein GDO78_013791 [Eleutherodactylus coqui]|uniref:Chromatin assembly factor 1 subunit A n=1 Tax=Eleutherodactylus coqui TaxID=57060 RepID=A0A8J6EM93_ELECQ|nr:hypothetical protein GDO78_013791 [Eleutherodactylus coqui]